MAVVSGKDDARDYLTDNVLGPGERVQWRGRPALFSATREDPRHLLVAIVYLAIAFVAARYVEDPAPWLHFALFIILFFGSAWFLAGLVTAAKNEFLAARREYAVTDRRVIVITRFLGARVQSYFPPDIAQVAWVERGRDRGSITLGLMPKAPEAPKFKWPGAPISIILTGIRPLREAVRAVEHLKMGQLASRGRSSGIE